MIGIQSFSKVSRELEFRNRDVVTIQQMTTPYKAIRLRDAAVAIDSQYKELPPLPLGRCVTVTQNATFFSRGFFHLFSVLLPR